MRTILAVVFALAASAAVAPTGSHAQPQPVTWTRCTQHLDWSTATRITHQTCTHYRINHPKGPVIGRRWLTNHVSPHVRVVTIYPIFQKPEPAILPACYYPAVRAYSAPIYAAAKRFGIAPGILAAQIEKESSGLPNVSSQGGDGADIGLMQYGPTAAAIVVNTYGVGGYSYDPATNILTGAGFDAYLRDHYAGGDIWTAIRMYNGSGPLAEAYAAWVRTHVCA